MTVYFDKQAFDSLEEKPMLYLILDTETATLPFADELAEGDSEKKKKIAIARPLVYNIAWRIIDKDNKIYSQKSYLIAEIFSVPSIFNTAYYKDKRPFYFQQMKNGEITLVPWEQAMSELMEDLAWVNYCGAFNSMFDYKKAIPFTELYIKKVYSNDYQSWEAQQKELCRRIMNEPYRKNDESEFDKDTFLVRSEKIPLIDVWGIACQMIINNVKFKKLCLENNMISDSGEYFKTSAEAVYRFLQSELGFKESHTALEDVIIECAILCQALSIGEIQTGIIYFPFRELGKTSDFLLENVGLLQEIHYQTVIKKMMEKLEKTENKHGQYFKKLSASCEVLIQTAEYEFAG